MISDRKKFSFIGCSLTYGTGLEKEKNDVNNYANIVAEYFDSDVLNLSVPGNNNHNIFLSALEELVMNRPTILFVQWSGVQRLEFFPTPEIANSLKIMNSVTSESNYEFINSIHSRAGIFDDKKSVDLFHRQLMLLNKDTGQIVNLIKYVNLLQEVARQFDCRIVFINGLVYWTKELLNPNIKNYVDELSEYTKYLVDFNLNDDKEIEKWLGDLYNRMQTINKSHWVNIFKNLLDLSIDKGNDGRHPGVKSHKKYANMIIKHLLK